jgi:CHAD domain-containing protein
MAGLSPSEILQKRVESLADELSDVAEGEVEAIHRTRVATRRLREVLPIAVADRAARNLNRSLRDVNRVLGPVRELDVLAELIVELEPKSRYSIAAVGSAVARARKEASDQLESCAQKLSKVATRLNGTVVELQSKEAVDFRKVKRNCQWAIQARIIKRAVRLGAAIDRAGILYASGPLHEVRVSVKKLRYAIELSDEIGEARPGAVKTLKSVQDLLGRQHDLEMLLQWARQVQVSTFPGASWREPASLTSAIEGDCRQLHARYARERSALTSLISHVAANDKAEIDFKRAAG